MPTPPDIDTEAPHQINSGSPSRIRVSGLYTRNKWEKNNDTDQYWNCVFIFYILLFVVTILIVSDHPLLIVSDHPLVGFSWWCQKTHWSRGNVNSPHYRCWRNAFTITITSCRHHLHSALMCHRSPELMAQDGMLNQRGHHYFRDPALYLEFYFQFNRIIWLSGQIMSHCKYFHCLTLTNCSAWVWQICSKMPPLHRSIIHQRHLHFQIVSRRRDVNQVQNVSIIKQWPLNNYWD